MAKRNRKKKDLRKLLGEVSFNKGRRKAGVKLKGKRLSVRVPPSPSKVPKGTPKRAASTGQIEIPAGCTRSGKSYRQVEDVRLPIDLLPATAVLQLSRVFVDDSSKGLGSLSHELVERVERLKILEGHSSTIIAAASIYFAGPVIRSKSGGKVVQALTGDNRGPVFAAYNLLWLRREDFVEIVKRYGGTMTRLRPPVMQDGITPDQKTFETDLQRQGLSAGSGPAQSGISRKRGVAGRRSRLSNVEAAPKSPPAKVLSVG